jgi:C1A family cysteine protease
MVLNASGRVFAVGLCPELVEGPPPLEGPVGQLAPTRPPPLTPPPPHTGYIPPPMDLSHLKGDRMPEAFSAAALPSKWDWRQQGVVTQVQNQGNCGSCFTFASLANFESRLQIDGAGTYDFSENNAKECSWEEVNNFESPPGNPWGSCDGGDYFMLANLFSQKGTVLEWCDPYVDRDVGCKDSCPYIKTLLDWRYISYEVPDTNVLKGYIHNHGPVYTSIYAGNGDAWQTEFGYYDGSYTLYHPGTESPNHAVLIVGWDDDLSHAGGMGGWIVKNSWGSNWGDNGYFYIAYGSASIGTGSSSIYAWQDYDPNGDIMYYDEAGWWNQWGCGSSTTGWGLSKFIPTSDTYVTRVEFWTTDRTTDIDVYIYDNFNGVAPSNLLWSGLNYSFAESGYHGVELYPPLAVTGGNDVIAVVKFTNASYEYPVPVDTEGPDETGRTYRSCSGSAGSWQDMGVDHDADVAIRLRTSDITAPTPTPTSTLPPLAFRVYLPICLKDYGVSLPTPTPTTTSMVTPTSTPTATPTSTPPTTGVYVRPNHSFYIDIFGYLNIVGEVENNTAHHLWSVGITANVFNSSGKLLDNGFNYIYLDNLPTGDKTCFCISLEEPTNWSYYEFEPPSYWTDGEPLPNLTVLNDSGYYDPFWGGYEIIGQVRNDHGARVEDIFLVGTLYNASNIVMDCDFTYIDAIYLDPGQASPFEMTFFWRDYANVTSYRLQVDGSPQ